MPLATFVHVLTRPTCETDLSTTQVWVGHPLFTKLLVLCSLQIRAPAPQPGSRSLQDPALLISVRLAQHSSSAPHLHHHPPPKVYTPAKPIFTVHSLHLLLHAFTHASLCTGKAPSLLCVCGNPTHPAERQLSKTVINITGGQNARVEIPALPFRSCTALDKLLNLSLLQSPHLKKRDNNGIHVTRMEECLANPLCIHTGTHECMYAFIHTCLLVLLSVGFKRQLFFESPMTSPLHHLPNGSFLPSDSSLSMSHSLVLPCLPLHTSVFSTRPLAF